MPRISGINLKDDKKIKVALAAIYGLGKINVFPLLRRAQVDPEKRTKNMA